MLEGKQMKVKSWSSGLQHHVMMWQNTIVFEEFPAFIFTLKMEAAKSSKTLVFYHTTTWCHNPEDHNSIFITEKTSLALHEVTPVFNRTQISK
jgi:hypothetical protein